MRCSQFAFHIELPLSLSLSLSYRFVTVSHKLCKFNRNVAFKVKEIHSQIGGRQTNSKNAIICKKANKLNNEQSRHRYTLAANR